MPGDRHIFFNGIRQYSPFHLNLHLTVTEVAFFSKAVISRDLQSTSQAMKVNGLGFPKMTLDVSIDSPLCWEMGVAIVMFTPPVSF